MDIDIRQIKCGGWESSQINAKSNGKWRYFYTPENPKPVNSKEPIQYGAGYKPPKPSKYLAKLSQQQYLKRNQESSDQYFDTSRTSSSLNRDPYTGLSSFSSPQRDNIHPVRQKFLLDSVKNRPKAPYTFYSNASDNCESKSVNTQISNLTNPPFMSNENFQTIHEQNQKAPRIRRRCNSQNQPPIYNKKPEIAETDLFQFEDYSTSRKQNKVSARTQQDANQRPRAFSDSTAALRCYRPSIDGVSKPLLTFKCMVQPNNHTLYLGTDKPIDLSIENNLPDDIKNYIKVMQEERKRQREEPENEENLDELLNYNNQYP